MAMSMKSKREALFIIGVAIYLTVLLISASRLAPASREFPMVIIGTAFVVIVLKLMTYKFPWFKIIDPSESTAKLKTKPEEPKPRGQDDAAKSPPAHTPGGFMIWLATFPLGAYLLGFLPAIIIWLFLFLMLLSKSKLLRALLICACMFAAIYLLFVVVLQVYFPKGILF